MRAILFGAHRLVRVTLSPVEFTVWMLTRPIDIVLWAALAFVGVLALEDGEYFAKVFGEKWDAIWKRP